MDQSPTPGTGLVPEEAVGTIGGPMASWTDCLLVANVGEGERSAYTFYTMITLYRERGASTTG